eukprot:scpid53472/ scgid24150/ Carboxypeptidase N subunit 2; Carboxypeptidase N 83 kDa chain; Carboxypeptidase N large subunit; Carboxypeptidase N polypeptide 2; Carboxypeptidase N regulatory subunit
MATKTTVTTRCLQACHILLTAMLVANNASALAPTTVPLPAWCSDTSAPSSSCQWPWVLIAGQCVRNSQTCTQSADGVLCAQSFKPSLDGGLPIVNDISSVAKHTMQALTFEGYTITKLNVDTFRCYSSLRSLKISLFISDMPEDIFKYNSQLENMTLTGYDQIVLPPGLLQTASLLRVFRISGAVESIPLTFFRSTPLLQTFHVEQSSIKALPAGLFASNLELKEFIVEKSNLYYLQDSIFTPCLQLRVFELNDVNLIFIPELLFAKTTQLTSFKLVKPKFSYLPKNLFINTTILSSFVISFANFNTLPATLLHKTVLLQTFSFVRCPTLFAFQPLFFNTTTHLRMVNLTDSDISPFPVGFFGRVQYSCEIHVHPRSVVNQEISNGILHPTAMMDNCILAPGSCWLKETTTSCSSLTGCPKCSLVHTTSSYFEYDRVSMGWRKKCRSGFSFNVVAAGTGIGSNSGSGMGGGTSGSVTCNDQLNWNGASKQCIKHSQHVSGGMCSVGDDCVSGFTCSNSACTDVNECSSGASLCHDVASCRNSPGSYQCSCQAGYGGDGHHCFNLDECLLGTHLCSNSSAGSGARDICDDTVGSYQCLLPSTLPVTTSTQPATTPTAATSTAATSTAATSTAATSTAAT